MQQKSNWHTATAQRLRSLREAKGLNYTQLKEEVERNCGVCISADSLANYEITATQNHTKANKTKGMKIEFLRSLAKYYGVSSDWLLGISDVKNANAEVKSIVNCCGLSETSAEALFLANKTAQDLVNQNCDTSKFREFFNIPESASDNSLFSVCVAIPDFLDAIMVSVLTDDSLLAKITTAFNMWLASQPFADLPESQLREGNVFVEDNRIAIDRGDFIKLCSYEIANTVANALARHYQDRDNCNKP